MAAGRTEAVEGLGRCPLQGQSVGLEGARQITESKLALRHSDVRPPRGRGNTLEVTFR